jgi:CBS domain-containing protein
MNVSDIMRRSLTTIKPDAPLLDAALLLQGPPEPIGGRGIFKIMCSDGARHRAPLCARGGRKSEHLVASILAARMQKL